MSQLHTNPEDRKSVLDHSHRLKMAESAHAYVRGNTVRFYDWLATDAVRGALPGGPDIWICGDCHTGNLGPVANVDGKIEIEIRDLDQTVIGNPAHDLLRLGLSLAMSARSSDLPGVTTARMIEHAVDGYAQAFSGEKVELERSESVYLALKDARRRSWRHLAKERIGGETVTLPIGS